MYNESNCNGNGDCKIGILERPRYYDHQLVGSTELNLTQDYFRKRLRTHNRMLHGWGVVCGAEVFLVPKDDKKPGCDCETKRPAKPQGKVSDWQEWQVKVTSGYLLGPYGDEINIDREYVFDIREAVLGIVAGKQPWQSSPRHNIPAGKHYLAISYEEILSRPVRVQPPGCGCEPEDCQYTRWIDSFQIRLFHDLPPGYECCRLPDDSTKPSGTKIIGVFPQGCHEKCEFIAAQDEECCSELTQCPCPDGPWIVLAIICVDDCEIVDIDNWCCRRMVVTHAHECWTCVARPMSPPDDKKEKPDETPIDDQSRIKDRVQVRLDAIDVESLEGVGPQFAARLRANGILSARDLLSRGETPEARQIVVAELNKSKKRGQQNITESDLANWVSQADLLGPLLVVLDEEDEPETAIQVAEKMVENGIKSIGMLTERDPKALSEELGETGEEQFSRLQRAIEIAGKLPKRVRA